MEKNKPDAESLGTAGTVSIVARNALAAPRLLQLVSGTTLES